jgi:hypothetical protein
MSKRLQYDLQIDTPRYIIEVSRARFYGYFEHKTLGDERGGGLWFERWNILDVLTDYDGTPTFPLEVAQALARHGYTIGAEFYDHPDDNQHDSLTIWRGLRVCGPFYTISKRETRLGGGYNLKLYEHGEEQGGGAFPAKGDLPELLSAALADAEATGEEWRASRSVTGTGQ